ncbi:MAG: ASCH domain-containing protein [Candidatus Caldarchaeum sp.]|jgi:hypothetical protein|uniref:ASCH domain-containing protein n=1 Tax=Caldiarchaeum subterraneum TaxID=311458 RepID=A0A7C4I6E7_CALS0|nr:ASCH domain-containing protein [Candidatus Caldarchaeales archaeon]MDJ0272120.1 ASCH domain-containing protein [Candidatus Caldarchaeales archaeon]
MRRILRFKPMYLDLILKGLKTSTIRPGDGGEYARELILTDGNRRIAAELLAVEVMTLREAVNTRYQLEGYSSPEELYQSIKKIYNSLGPDDPVTIIHFIPKT